MFRFIALSWSIADTAAGALATAWSRRLLTGPGWQPALQVPGLLVAVAGAREDGPGFVVLPRDRGVIVGTMHDSDGAGPFRPLELFADEAGNADPAATSCEVLLRSCWGSYVAFLRRPDGEVDVFRDPTGALPCYRMRHQRVDLAFSWLEDVLQAAPDLPLPDLDWDRLAGILHSGDPGDRGTALRGVLRVVPGELAALGAGREGRLLWHAARIAAQPLDIDAHEAADLLGATIRRCVGAVASSRRRLLLRLSGGLDSSILATCMARQTANAEVICVNHHSGGAHEDERAYARTMASLLQLPLVECERDAGFDLRRVLDFARTPVPDGYVGRMGAAAADAALAERHRATAMFTGGGGDQLFFAFRQWWPAADHLRHRGLSRDTPRAMLEGARLGEVSVWHALAQAAADRLRRRDPWHACAPAARGALNARAWPDRLPVRHVHPALASPTGLPIGKFMQVRALLHAPDPYDPQERERAPELLNPLLSQPVMELCLRLPTWVLAAGGISRGLVRRAFAAELPPEIVQRRSKGGIENHLDVVLRRNRAFAESLLLDGELVRHGLLDRTTLATMLADRPGRQATAAGEIHTLLGIEAWVRLFRTADVRR